MRSEQKKKKEKKNRIQIDIGEFMRCLCKCWFSGHFFFRLSFFAPICFSNYRSFCHVMKHNMYMVPKYVFERVYFIFFFIFRCSFHFLFHLQNLLRVVKSFTRFFTVKWIWTGFCCSLSHSFFMRKKNKCWSLIQFTVHVTAACKEKRRISNTKQL